MMDSGCFRSSWRFFVVLVGIATIGLHPAMAPAAWDTLGTQKTVCAGITPCIATDSTGTVHLVYMASGRIYYRTGDGDGNFGSAEAIPLPGGSTGDYNSPHVVLDVNDVPHVTFEKDWISTSKTAWYTNRVGGSWKTPVVAFTVGADQRVNYPRLAVRGDRACVSAHTSGDDDSKKGQLALLNNLSSSPAVMTTRFLYYWVPHPVFNRSSELFAPGRKGANGHYIQQHNTDNLNPIGGETKISVGTPVKTGEPCAAVMDGSDVLHVAGTTWEDSSYAQRVIFYNSTQRLGQGKNSIWGMPNGEAGERLYPTMTMDASGTIYIAYRDYATGEGKAVIVVGDGFTGPVTFAASVTNRLRWNPHMAATPSGGVYAVWDSSSTVYFRRVGDDVSGAILSFTNITDSASVAGPGHYGGHGAMWADVTGDDQPDLYVTMNYSPTDMAELFYRNVSGASFAEEATSRGIDDFDTGSHGGVWGDLDNDGDYDLVNGGYDRNRVFENNGAGSFTDRTSGSGFLDVSRGTRGTITFDFDKDGDLDVFCNNWAPDSEANEFYRNDGSFSFTSIDNGLGGVIGVQGTSEGDFDNDGDLDLLICRGFGDDGALILMRNTGGSFSAVSNPGFGSTANAQDGATWVDVNNDGWLDVHVMDGNFAGTGTAWLFTNDQNGSTFTSKSVPTGPGFMAGFEDLDNDGDWDMVYTGDNKVYLNDGSGNFTASSTFNLGMTDDPRAVAFADIDDDGDVDFFYAYKRSYNRLVRNDLANGGNWLKVKLTSPSGQAGAFGAKVKTYEAGYTGNPAYLISFREARSNEGYLGQNEPVLHFGVGARSSVDVEVTFLDGTVTTQSSVAVNQTIVIGGSSTSDTAKLWEPVEWSYSNTSYSGNPYDLVATATFTHTPTSDQIVTELYCDGGTTWKLRFTGTQTGEWTYTTSSSDSDLNGLTGSITIQTNPGVAGFRTNYGNRWGRLGLDKAFVPQHVMGKEMQTYYATPAQIDDDIEMFFGDHGFNGIHTYVLCRWFDINEDTYDSLPADANPDSRTFQTLESLITKVHAAGGVVHLWQWGDEQRHQTPIGLTGGINGSVDQRLQRYICARLGPLPGWAMGYGFDLQEWVTGSQLDTWHTYMHNHLGWDHFLGARSPRNQHPTQLSDNMDYSSYEQWKPTYDSSPENPGQGYVYGIESHAPTKPSFWEDRFRVREGYVNPEKDWTEEETRRGLYDSTLAGGAANIWGYLILPGGGTPDPQVSLEYPNKHWILTYSRFFRLMSATGSDRFTQTMVRDNGLTDGVCLRDSNTLYVFYKENTSSINMDLSGMSGSKPAAAVDATANYEEIPLGTLSATSQVFNAPYASDWIVVVGDPALTEVSVDLGRVDREAGLFRVDVGDGSTVVVDQNGKNCRRNADAGSDYYMYFNVVGSYAYEGSQSEVYITIDYYDAGTGSLTLQYDGSGGAYTSDGSVTLTGTNTWKQHVYHVTDAYFGNRQNGGADLRIYGGMGNTFYLDRMGVSESPPTPPGQATNPDPTHGIAGVDLDADLSWTAGSGATSHDVYFGTSNPPPFQISQGGTTYDPGTMDGTTTHYWRIDEVNATATTTGVVWSFTTAAGGVPETFSTSSFDSTGDGWTIVTWESGSYDLGTMAHDGSVGNPAGSMQSTGNGGTNSTDSCTREGGEIKKVISTQGYEDIEVSYDLRFDTDQTGTSCSGTCTGEVMEGDCADKLAVYYSTSGIDGPWNLLQQVYASAVAQGSFSTRALSIPAAADNLADFALRFRFQFNTSDDTGRLDNIEVAGVALAPAAADFDNDGDVDQEDFGHFQSCLSGEGVSQNDPDCQDAKLDGDYDVDVDDFSVFLGCMGGANQPPGC